MQQNDNESFETSFMFTCQIKSRISTKTCTYTANPVFVNIFLLSETFVRAVLFGNTEGFSGFTIL
jgi:hypothetical protein